MTRQRFNTSDVLRLEVAGDPDPGSMPNLIRNTGGALGGWGWLSPVPDSTVTSELLPEGLQAPGLRITTTATQPLYVTTEFIPVEASATHVKGAISRLFANDPTIGIRAKVVCYDASLTQLGATTATTLNTTDGVSIALPSAAMPAGTAYVKFRVDVYRAGGNPTAGDRVTVDRVILVAGTATQLAGMTQLDPGWVDVLGPTHDIALERAELDLGTLNATILDSSLDPSQTETLRKGKRVRLVLDNTSEPLFTGEILNAKATYDPLQVTASKRTRVQLTAVDQAQPLSNVSRPDGVAAVEELRYVLEGCGVPWNVNGNTGQTPDVPAVVSRVEDASAMDQVAITRDSNLGYAWFSRAGVVNVWDATALTAAHGTSVATLQEDTYNADGLSIDYDSDRCINHVTLKYLRIDPVTGETAEVTYGPYTDDVSRAKWGTHAAEFTVQGITEDTATLTAYAGAILTANATPAVRLNEATVPLNTTGDVDAWASLDLYDLVTVVNVAAGINEESRITRLSHRIEGGKWTVTYGFTTEGAVAQPQVTPSPSPSGGKTLPQLLRPVGEVTMWFGALADIPAGWLRCDGVAIPSDYPDLIALVGANTPNMVDVFPIGAGTKALGTNGGDPTKLIGVTNLPAHHHGYDRRASAAALGSANSAAAPSTTGTLETGQTSDTGGGTPLDVMNPWRALHFIIRAR